MTIFSTGQWVDTMFMFLNLDNGVRVQLTTKAASQGITLVAKDCSGQNCVDITPEIADLSVAKEANTYSADILIQWLAKAREYKSKEGIV